MKIISNNESIFQPVTIVIETEEELKTLYLKINVPDQVVLKQYHAIYFETYGSMLTSNSMNIWRCIRSAIDKQHIQL